MEIVLEDLVQNIRPETRGLLEYLLEVTGFSAEEIISQSIFAFYPYLYAELGTGIETWLIMNKVVYSQFQQLKAHYQFQNDNGMICKLFEIEPDTSQAQVALNLHDLNQLVRQTVGFDERTFISKTDTDQLEYFLESCILQYLLMIYPVEIMEDVFAENTDQFVKISFRLTASQIKTFIQHIPPSFSSRKFEEEVNRRVFKMFNHLYALRVL